MPPRALHTSTFRLSIYFASFFVAVVALLLGLVYWAVSDFIIDRTDAQIDHDVATIEQAFATGGEAGVEELIKRETGGDPFQTFIYEIVGANGERRTGNLIGLSGAPAIPSIGRSEFVIPPAGPPPAEPHTIRIRTTVLPGGALLVVGRDIYDPLEIRERVSQIIGSGLLGAAILAGLGGWVISRAMLRRVDAIARASRSIMDGHLEQRLPVGRANDEFDQLAAQVNTMLDRVEALMTEVRQVTTGIAHDLRSPLTRLRVRIEKAQLERGKDADPIFEELAGELDGIRAIFDALLRIAQIEGRDARSGFRAVDLSHLADQAGELYRTVAEDKGLTWAAAIEEGIGVDGDGQLIAQALSNLLENAVKYTPAGGRVSLRLDRIEDRAELVVEDSGPGIPPVARSQVLKHFFRLEDSRSTPGAGLGLALVAAVTKLHGADLVLDDACPGLRVRLRLKAAEMLRT